MRSASFSSGSAAGGAFLVFFRCIFMRPPYYFSALTWRTIGGVLNHLLYKMNIIAPEWVMHLPPLAQAFSRINIPPTWVARATATAIFWGGACLPYGGATFTPLRMESAPYP
jgi:hypothetical protein